MKASQKKVVQYLGGNPLTATVGVVESVVGQALALGKP